MFLTVYIRSSALAGNKVVSAPSASTVLKGRFPFTESMVPFEVPVPVAPRPPPGAPACPACRILKLDQFCPIDDTCGSRSMVWELIVFVTAPFSVFSSGTSVLTTTWALTARQLPAPH